MWYASNSDGEQNARHTNNTQRKNMKRTMRARARKILLASTLAVLGGFSGSGWGPGPVMGQEATMTAEDKDGITVVIPATTWIITEAGFNLDPHKDWGTINHLVNTGAKGQAQFDAKSMAECLAHPEDCSTIGHYDEEFWEMCRKARNEPNLKPTGHTDSYRILAANTRVKILKTQGLGDLMVSKTPIVAHYVEVQTGYSKGACGWLADSQINGGHPVEATRESLLGKRFGLTGHTYKIEDNDIGGKDYYMVARGQSRVVRTSTGRMGCSSSAIRFAGGPNVSIISGYFKFIGNLPGTNGYGTKTTIEAYEPFTDEEFQLMDATSTQEAPKQEPPKHEEGRTTPAIDLNKIALDEANRVYDQVHADPGASAREAKRLYDQIHGTPVVTQTSEPRPVSVSRGRYTLPEESTAPAATSRSELAKTAPATVPVVATAPVPASTTDPAHEARKARAAYLIQYIIETGNAIDQLNADGRNPRNYWRAILDAQNEILNIYKVELRNACQVNDEHAISVLKANIDKISNGRDFAWNATR